MQTCIAVFNSPEVRYLKIWSSTSFERLAIDMVVITGTGTFSYIPVFFFLCVFFWCLAVLARRLAHRLKLGSQPLVFQLIARLLDWGSSDSNSNETWEARPSTSSLQQQLTSKKTYVSRGSEFLFAKYYLDYLKLSEGSVTSRMIFKLTVMVEWVQNIFQYEVKFTVQYWGHAIEENLIP